MSRSVIKTKSISVSKIEKSCVAVGELLRSLAHPQRLLILGHLTQGPKTVSQLQDLCQISQSQLSQFLGRMKSEGLVACQRQGRYQYYQAADANVLRLIAAIQDIYCH